MAAVSKRKNRDATEAQPNATKKHSVAGRGELALLLAFVLFVVLRLLAAFIDASGLRLWGIDMFAYQPLGWELVTALIIPLLLLLPPVRRGFGGLLEDAQSPASRGGLRMVLSVLTLVALAVLAWELQVAYAFLGDGAYYATEIFRIADDPSYKTALVKPTSWLTGTFLRWLAVTFQPENVRWPFQVAGSAAMVVMVGGALLLLRRARTSEVLLLVGSALLSSGTLMFFGYIELYAFAYACTALYFIAAYRCFRGDVAVLLPAVFLAFAIAFSASAAIFIPSYLLLLHWKLRGEEGGFPLRRAAVVLLMLTLLGVIALYFLLGASTYNPYVLALAPAELVEQGIYRGTQHYTVFSGAHVIDVVNALLLNVGVWLFALPVLLFLSRGRLRWIEPALLFALVAASAGVLLLFVGNTTLGLARDWDLMTIPALALTFAVSMLLLELGRARGIVLSLTVPMLLLVALGSSFGWLRLNFDEDASARRLADILRRDKDVLLPLNTYTGLENLRKFHYSKRDAARQRDVLRSMAETGVQRIDTWAKYAALIVEMSDASARAREYEWLFDQFAREYRQPAREGSSAWIDARSLRENLTKSLLFGLQTADVEVTQRYLAVLKPLVPSWREAALLDAYLTPGITIERIAEAARLAVDDSTADASLQLAAARVHTQASQWLLAAEYYERSLQRDARSYPVVYMELAGVYIERLNDLVAAERVLRRCVREVPASPEAAQAGELLSRLGV
ncbi:MAG TPA: hypothetical protein PK916_05435 [Bacteroidota bacterium]|nr:hypothetical protein [Bacteroidota bacterium]